MKRVLHRIISSGLTPELSEDLKVAIQVANADVLLTILTLAFYSFPALFGPPSPLSYIHPIGLVVAIVGFLLIRFQKFDIGRILIHINGLVMIFCPADMYEGISGFEFYYFISVTIPFVTFTFTEYKKGLVLSVIAAVLLISQEYLGPGILFDTFPAPEGSRLEATVVVMIYLIAIFAVARWQLSISQKVLRKKQQDLIMKSNLLTLGEMSEGIAHEINNPLQSLTLEIELLKRELEKEQLTGKRVPVILTNMNETSIRLGKMIKGLKDLSRDYIFESPEIFDVEEAVKDVVASKQETISKLNVAVEISGTRNILIKGRTEQFARVLTNLLANAFDAIESSTDRKIWIDYQKAGNYLVLSITDSGSQIDDSIAEKMMRPFYTTKEPSKRTGLGLSIASSIISKNGGRLYFDNTSLRTRFVIEYPLA